MFESRLRIEVVLIALATIAAACSVSAATDTALPDVESHDDVDCFLGLGLWDHDPALTWIEDGRVWVRAGDSQACLTLTYATSLQWSLDNRRAFLDNEIADGIAIRTGPDTTRSRQVIGQRPLGDKLFVVGAEGEIASHDIDSEATAPVNLPSGAVMIAGHPDGEHVAVVDTTGRFLLASRSGENAELLALQSGEQVLQIEFYQTGVDCGFW